MPEGLKDPEAMEDLTVWEITDMWRSLIGRGQHRELVTRLKLVTKVQNSSSHENHEAQDLETNGEKTHIEKKKKTSIPVTIGLLEYLPAEVFVDVFEVARLKRSMSVEVFGKIDLESPSTRAQETISLVQVSAFAELKSEKMKVSVEVRLPLHSRYPALVSPDSNNTFKCGKSHVLIKIPLPFVVIDTKDFFETGIKNLREDNCSEAKNKVTVSRTKYNDDKIPETKNNEDNFSETKNNKWELVFRGRSRIVMQEQEIVWMIPIGCRGHFEIVFWITTLVSLLGALHILCCT